MSTASPEIQELARRLLAEAAHDNSGGLRGAGAVRVIDELRKHLIRLTGVHGFRSLLSRALTLAKAQVPSLNTVQVDADSSLEGFDEIERREGETAKEAGIVLVAHLLELLVTFIGAPLTLGLLRDKWPNASIEETALRTEEKQ
jgi:hypothetical protein